MLYFAYGSNMCTGRLSRRAPSATFICVARIAGYVFCFHKRSSDGSGKGNVFVTEHPGDVVWGVVFDIDDDHKSALDEAEGLGSGYLEKIVTVMNIEGTEIQAVMYYAEPEYIDANLQPYSWYKRFVVDGARQHNLPSEYVDAIVAMPSREDPDRDRDRRRRAVTC